MMPGTTGGGSASVTTGASNTGSSSTNTSQQRSQQRERERHEREQQINLLTNGESYGTSPNRSNSNLFDEPIKQQHKDETAKRIKDTLGKAAFLFYE